MRPFSLSQMGLVRPQSLTGFRPLLLSNGYIHPAFGGLLRASPAALFRTDGTLAEYANNVARFDPQRGLLLEGQRTNVVTNPRAEGAVAGTPGTVPTGWGTRPSGCATQIIGATTINGIPGLAFRIVGTPTSTATQAWSMSASNTCTVGDTICTGGYFAILAGSMANISSFSLRGNAGNDNGVNLSNTWTSTPQPFERRWTSTTGASMQPVLRWSYSNTTTPVDITIFIGALQQRITQPFLDSPILPPIGAPGATTRAREFLSASLGALGIPATGFTAIWRYMLPQNAPAAADQVLFQIDAGSDANRFRLRNSAGGAAIVAGRVTGGVAVDATSLGNMTAGTSFGGAMVVDLAAGTASACLKAGSVQTLAGGPTSGLTTLRLADNFSQTAALFGYQLQLSVSPSVMPDAALPALAAAA